MKKITKKLKKLIQEAYDLGWDEGWDSGYNANDDSDESYDAGVEAAKENVQTRLKALEELYMQTGKGTKAVAVREIAEFLAFEYDPEKAMDDYKKSLDNEGF
jgi:hypothetical protein